MSDTSPDYEQLLEQAFAEMRKAPLLGDVPAEGILDRLQPSQGTPLNERHPQPRKRFAMIFSTKFAAVIALGLLVAGLFFGLHGAGDSPAFGDVIQRVRDARTMTCQLTITPAGRPAMTSKAFFLGSHAFRTQNDTAVTVVDSEKKTMMVLDVPHKTATLWSRAKANAPATAPADADNWLDRLKMIDAKSDTPVGTREIAGKAARGFRVVEPAGEYVVWADAKTGVPLRVEMSIHAAGSEMAVVMDQMTFDAELQESLFSVEPPPGYVLRKASTGTGPSGEQDMLAFLRDYAGRAGAYPSSLSDWNKTFEALMPKDSHKKADPAALNVILEGGRAASFLGSLPKDANWHYAGNAVRPGESKPLFWYRPPGSNTYRTLYGDLRISDLDETELPR